MKSTRTANKATVKPASVADILGPVAATRSRRVTDWPSHCNFCEKPLLDARVAALKELKTPTELWACVGCSTITPKQAIYTGEVGTSPLLFVDKLYNYGVRDVFGGSDDATPNEEPQEKE